MKRQRDPDAFRVTRGRSYQRWTKPEGCSTKTWQDMLDGVMGLNKIDPETVAGFRVQINFKSDISMSGQPAIQGSVTETP